MAVSYTHLYRQDYLDEFNMLWEKQAVYHKELTEELKKEIRDIITVSYTHLDVYKRQDGPYLSMRLPRRPIFSVVLLLPLAIN